MLWFWHMYFEGGVYLLVLFSPNRIPRCANLLDDFWWAAWLNIYQTHRQQELEDAFLIFIAEDTGSCSFKLLLPFK